MHGAIRCGAWWLVGVSFATTTGGEATAQVSLGGFYRGKDAFLFRFIDRDIQRQVQARNLLEQFQRKTPPAGAAAPEPSTTTPPGSAAPPDSTAAAPSDPVQAPPPSTEHLRKTDFKPLRGRLLLGKLIAKTQGMTRKQKKELRSLYLTTFKAFEEQARKNNVAHALTFVLAVSLQILLGREIPDAEMQTIAKEMHDALLAAPSFRKAKRKRRQLMYEACVIAGGTMLALLKAAADGDDNAKAQAHDHARVIATALLGEEAAKLAPEK
jgi:hypothetical protein